MKSRIEKFLNVSHSNSHCNGFGYGYGNGNGKGRGDGTGFGYGKGCDNGTDYGDDTGFGYGKGCGNGTGYGDGTGFGNGYGFGTGNGNGTGYGDGKGCDNGTDYGYGYGDGIVEYDGHRLYDIDGLHTIITNVRGNIAQGYIFFRNQPKPCYIVKENDCFAHGNTLHDAFLSLQEKLYNNRTEEERLQAFKQKFPDYDTPYDNEDLLVYHHVLTGSCRMGREQFCKNHNIPLNGTTTVREFVKLTKDAYGGDIVKELSEMYKTK